MMKKFLKIVKKNKKKRTKNPYIIFEVNTSDNNVFDDDLEDTDSNNSISNDFIDDNNVESNISDYYYHLQSMNKK